MDNLWITLCVLCCAGLTESCEITANMRMKPCDGADFLKNAQKRISERKQDNTTEKTIEPRQCAVDTGFDVLRTSTRLAKPKWRADSIRPEQIPRQTASASLRPMHRLPSRALETVGHQVHARSVGMDRKQLHHPNVRRGKSTLG